VLIPSSRHTRKDLELWSLLESTDKLHANSGEFRRRHVEALNAIIAFTDDRPFYVGVSWGKDSVVVAHLVRCIMPTAPLVHLRQEPFDNPDTIFVRDEFLKQFPATPYREIVVDYRDLPPDPTLAEREGDRRFFEAFKQVGHRHISGVRAVESGVRKIRMRRWGLESPNTLAPIGWWPTVDVFAYLAEHDLPVHPAYACLGGGRWQRERIRVDALCGEGGIQFGRAEWEREYYGAELRRLEAGIAGIAGKIT
jgi:phosphoadenosine phosphosulfate reductase